jgi:hypothetical protein
MSSEPKQVFAYTNFPLTQDPPGPLFEFRRTQGYFPGEVVVNSEYKVFWKGYLVKGPSLRPGGPLPPGGDIAGYNLPVYAVAIVYDDSVGLDQMVCRGRASQVESGGIREDTIL